MPVGQIAVTGQMGVRISNVGFRRGVMQYEAYRFSNGRKTTNRLPEVIETNTIDFPVKFTDWRDGRVIPQPENPSYMMYTINPVNWALIKEIQQVEEENLPTIDMNDVIDSARRAWSRFTRVVVVWDDGSPDSILLRHIEEGIFFLESF